MTIPLSIESSIFQGMFVVASIQFNGFALETVGFVTYYLLFFDFAVIASQFDNFLLVTAPTNIVVVSITSQVSQDMVEITFSYDGPILVTIHLHKIAEAAFTEPEFTFDIKVILISLNLAPHATHLVLNLDLNRVLSNIQFLELMIL